LRASDNVVLQAPSGIPDFRKPALKIVAQLTPWAPHWSTASGTSWAGSMMKA
jgi:hypothetical protein